MDVPMTHVAPHPQPLPVTSFCSEFFELLSSSPLGLTRSSCHAYERAA